MYLPRFSSVPASSPARKDRPVSILQYPVLSSRLVSPADPRSFKRHLLIPVTGHYSFLPQPCSPGGRIHVLLSVRLPCGFIETSPLHVFIENLYPGSFQEENLKPDALPTLRLRAPSTPILQTPCLCCLLQIFSDSAHTPRVRFFLVTLRSSSPPFMCYHQLTYHDAA